MCFDKGSAKKKLDQFLVIFQVRPPLLLVLFSRACQRADRRFCAASSQLYVLCKETMPMDVDFMLSDTFELIRPGMPLLKSFEDAGRAVDELMATQALQPPGASLPPAALPTCSHFSDRPLPPLLLPYQPRRRARSRPRRVTRATTTTSRPTPGSTTATRRTTTMARPRRMPTSCPSTTPTTTSSSVTSPKTR